MQIDWWTLALQAFNFLILVWLLSRFLYRPIKEVIEKRKALAGEAFAEAEAQKREAEAARKRFEDDRAALAGERQDMLKTLHQEMEGERARALEDAKKKADGMLDSARAAIAGEREAVTADMRAQATGLARDMAAALLREVGPTAPTEPFLDRITRHLTEMGAEERARLRKDLAGEEARLTVVTAADLTADEQARWRDGLEPLLHLDGRIAFSTDPDILGGAALRFPHASLTFTWADQLDQAKEMLQSDATAS